MVVTIFNPIGGHAFVIVGYGNYNAKKPTQFYFKFMNSWGSNWGDHGYGYLPLGIVESPIHFMVSAYAVNLVK